VDTVVVELVGDDVVISAQFAHRGVTNPRKSWP
jgi:hypothetical protein